jgi:hypothetical protein
LPFGAIAIPAALLLPFEADTGSAQLAASMTVMETATSPVSARSAATGSRPAPIGSHHFRGRHRFAQSRNVPTPCLVRSITTVVGEPVAHVMRVPSGESAAAPNVAVQITSRAGLRR